VKATLKRLHRYIAFTLALLWASQALTGIVMVYRWEVDDATTSHAPAKALDLAALGARIRAVEAQPPGTKVSELWATGGVNGRIDLYVDAPDGSSSIVRVDGNGQVLRSRSSDWDWRNGGFISAAADLHQTLFAGDTGKRIVGISGIFLLTSIVMGMVLAWPARLRQLKTVLAPKGPRPGVARRYAWHRAAGLWLAIPAIMFMTAGVLLTFESPLEHLLGLDAEPAELVAAPKITGETLAPERALSIALQRFPKSELAGAKFPHAETPWYFIRVRQPGEMRRVYGTTVVYVSAADGRILRVQDALAAPKRRAFMDSLYPVHTGEAMGWFGRVLALVVALWLSTMLVLGFGLWLARREVKR
jgi:uncharacterized iron-regulated membrane protein